MGRSRINTGTIPMTVESSPPSCTFRIFYSSHFPHCIFYTPHFAHCSFSNLLSFYASQILHAALNVFHQTLFLLQCSPFKSLFRSQIGHRKQRKAFFQDLLEVFLEFTPNTILVKDLYFGPKARPSACTAVGLGEMISCVLDYFLAPPTQVF